MDKFLNVELLRNPLNWFIVILMVTLASLMVNFITASASRPDAD